MLIELSKEKKIKTVHSSCYSFIYESVQHTHPKSQTSSTSYNTIIVLSNSEIQILLLPTTYQLQSMLLLVLLQEKNNKRYPLFQTEHKDLKNSVYFLRAM